MLILNLTGILVLLLAGEIYFRARHTYIVNRNSDSLRATGMIESNPDFIVYDSPAGRRLVPDAHVIIKHHRLSGLDVAIDTNSRGFRDRETPVEKRPGEIRVLALGDSITFGDYLPASEVWVEQAEQFLSQRYPDRPVEVINAGIGDIGLREEMALLREQGLELKPDWVVVGFYLNDARPPWGFPGELGGYGFLRRHSILAQNLYEKMTLRRWVKERGGQRILWPQDAEQRPWRTNPRVMNEFIKTAEFDWGSAWNSEAWTVIDEQLDLLKDLADEYHFRVMILCFPVRYQVYANYIEDAPQLEMEKRAAARDFEYLDLLPLLRSYRDREDLFFDHCHPRTFANQLIGRKLADELARRISASPRP